MGRFTDALSGGAKTSAGGAKAVTSSAKAIADGSAKTVAGSAKAVAGSAKAVTEGAKAVADGAIAVAGNARDAASSAIDVASSATDGAREFIREATPDVALLLNPRTRRTVKRDPQKEDIYEALANHPIFKYSHPSTSMEPSLEFLDYCNLWKVPKDQELLFDAALYGSIGLRAKVVMTTLWVIGQTLHMQRKSDFVALVSQTASEGLPQGKFVGDYADFMKELALILLMPLPEPLKNILNAIRLPDLNGPALRSPSLEDLLESHDCLKYSATHSPSVLLYQQDFDIIKPTDRAAQLLMEWFISRLFVGKRVTSRHELDKTTCWNAFLPQPSLNVPESEPKDEDGALGLRRRLSGFAGLRKVPKSPVVDTYIPKTPTSMEQSLSTRSLKEAANITSLEFTGSLSPVVPPEQVGTSHAQTPKTNADELESIAEFPHATSSATPQLPSPEVKDIVSPARVLDMPAVNVEPATPDSGSRKVPAALKRLTSIGRSPSSEKAASEGPAPAEPQRLLGSEAPEPRSWRRSFLKRANSGSQEIGVIQVREPSTPRIEGAAPLTVEIDSAVHARSTSQSSFSFLSTGDGGLRATSPQPVSDAAVVYRPPTLAASNGVETEETNADQAEPDSAEAALLRRARDLCTKDEQLTTATNRRLLVYSALALHPILDHARAQPQWTPYQAKQFNKAIKRFADLDRLAEPEEEADREQQNVCDLEPPYAYRRARMMIGLLFVVGMRLPQSQILSLVSGVVEAGLMRAQVHGEVSVPKGETDKSTQRPPYRMLCVLADTIDELVTQLPPHPHPMHSRGDGDPAVEDFRADNTIINTQDSELLVGDDGNSTTRRLYDVKRQPSALLRPQTVALVPETKLTRTIFGQLIDIFTLGSWDVAPPPISASLPPSVSADTLKRTSSKAQEKKASRTPRRRGTADSRIFEESASQRERDEDEDQGCVVV
ncbi:hypothetical protein EVG20_g8719 [Dentipellis fragilis]|uniref:Uncharacterized protein n=1 Tax=Dentipellis fragilis TaxID=205917 RepID=A0A4Y9Y599_9AGAM|nr:hypothetical protein EVG20_g8719 [Dentipellis fragilis]